MGNDTENRTLYAADAFQAAFGNDALFERIIEAFPYPMQVFSPDGTAVTINRAGEEMFGVRSESHIGRYNAFCDPIVIKNGVADQLKQVVAGKTVHLADFSGDYQDIVKYHFAEDKDIEALQTDITCFPMMRPDGSVGCFVAVFLVKKIYLCRDDIRKAKEYIDENWREKYDAAEAAKAANLSPSHFLRLFKKHIGVTPHDYYINVKVHKIKEHLLDESLTVAESFSACGADYHGNFAGVFKKKAGMSPTQYRKSIKNSDE